MLGLLKRSGNRLFEFVVPVTIGAATDVAVADGAQSVVCYAAAPDEDKAKQVAITHLHMRRCVTHAGWKVRVVDHSNWDQYARTRWPRSAPTLPNKHQVSTILQQGGFFFGPANPNKG